jgi:hypothetical protein
MIEQYGLAAMREPYVKPCVWSYNPQMSTWKAR